MKGNSMEFEDLEPQKGKLKPKDLTSWNIEELEQYIANMKLEITRVERVIENKKRVSRDATILFKQWGFNLVLIGSNFKCSFYMSFQKGQFLFNKNDIENKKYFGDL